MASHLIKLILHFILMGGGGGEGKTAPYLFVVKLNECKHMVVNDVEGIVSPKNLIPKLCGSYKKLFICRKKRCTKICVTIYTVAQEKKSRP